MQGSGIYKELIVLKLYVCVCKSVCVEDMFEALI